MHGLASFARGLAGILPLRVSRWLGRRFGDLAFGLLRDRKRLALANLERAFPEVDRSQRRRWARRSFQHTGAMFLQTVTFEKGLDRLRHLVDVSGWEHLERARSQGSGCFLLTAHYGCWDVAALALAERVGRLHLIAQEQSNPLIAATVADLRKRVGHEVLFRRGAGRKMLRIVREGGVVALAIDQRVRPWDGVLVPFLGQPAWTSPVLAYLVEVTGAPVIPVRCDQQENGRFQVTLQSRVELDSSADDRRARWTEQLLAVAEPWIREHPDRWFWLHSRWQRTMRHRRPATWERLALESNLDAPDATLAKGSQPTLADLPGIGEPLISRLRSVASTESLEAGRHVEVVASNDRGGSCVSRAQPVIATLGRELLARGHAVRAYNAEELAAELEECAAHGDLMKRIRGLDSYDLLILFGHEMPAKGLERLLAHRSHRSVLASFPLGQADDTIAI